jgi:hypothetical protein
MAALSTNTENSIWFNDIFSSEGENLRNPAKIEQRYLDNDTANRMHRQFIDFIIIHQTPDRRENIIVPVIIRRTITSPI